MKQVVQNFRSGELTVEEIPAPTLRDGSVLVANEYSLISTGTEGTTVKLGRMNLLQKARARPKEVQKVLNLIRTDGLLSAYNAVTRSLEIPIPLGYSCCGKIIEVADDVGDLEPGQLVACGGGGFANHAEVVCVPRNLVAPVPEGVDPRHGAFTTLGSIALQSVRIADVRVGENTVVIGLGLVGLLTAQILRAAGVRVFGIDVQKRAIDFAREHVQCEVALRGTANLKELVTSFTDGKGADAVIVTAATADNDPVALAGELARMKGKVVVVGRTSMEAPRDTYLFKELQLLTSLAYGPGTGDPSYELEGIDYPHAYVRWTENRNMSAVLELIAARDISLEPLVSREFDIADAVQAFDLVIGEAGEPTVAVLLRYPAAGEGKPTESPRVPLISAPPKSIEGRVGIGIIGAGSFATNFMVPLLAKNSRFRLCGIASASGLRAKALGNRYGFNFSTSDPDEVLRDPETDCVLILTRHDTHAPLTLQALEQGKHVFVEKPPAMSRAELDQILDLQQRSGLVVQVGFNRRFAPLARELKEFFAKRAQPLAMHYRSNVGHRPPEHWLHDPRQGGGIILGEAIHFVDFCHWLVDSPPQEVSCRAIGAAPGLVDHDTISIDLTFQDGSLATIHYYSNGDPSLSRERLEVYADRSVAVLEDFRHLECVRNGRSHRRRLRFRQSMGHDAQLEAFAESVTTSSQPTQFLAAAVSTLATLIAIESLHRHQKLPIDFPPENSTTIPDGA